MAIVLSLTAKQHEWLQSQLMPTESPIGMDIYEKLIRPVKAKQSAALLDAIVDSSIGTAANIGSDSTGSSGASLAEDGSLVAPEPEWDDAAPDAQTSGAGSEVLQPGALGVDLGLDNHQHADGFSGDTPASPEFSD